MFEGNNDSESISKQVLPFPVEATYVRIFPLQYQRWMCMRVELYGTGMQSVTRLCRVFHIYKLVSYAANNYTFSITQLVD